MDRGSGADAIVAVPDAYRRYRLFAVVVGQQLAEAALSVKLPAALASIQADRHEKDSKWKLVLKETVEIDALT